MKTRSVSVELALVLPRAQQEMLYAGPGGFSKNSDDATDLRQHIVEIHVGRLDRQLRAGEDPDVDCDLFEVRVLCDAADLDGLVGLGDRPNRDLVGMEALRDGCEPSICEVDLTGVLGTDTAGSGVLCGATDRPVVIEKIHHSN